MLSGVGGYVWIPGGEKTQRFLKSGVGIQNAQCHYVKFSNGAIQYLLTFVSAFVTCHGIKYFNTTQVLPFCSKQLKWDIFWIFQVVDTAARCTSSRHQLKIGALNGCWTGCTAGNCGAGAEAGSSLGRSSGFSCQLEPAKHCSYNFKKKPVNKCFPKLGPKMTPILHAWLTNMFCGRSSVIKWNWHGVNDLKVWMIYRIPVSMAGFNGLVFSTLGRFAFWVGYRVPVGPWSMVFALHYFTTSTFSWS